MENNYKLNGLERFGGIYNKFNDFYNGKSLDLVIGMRKLTPSFP